jgi:hypothetical protein
MDFALSFRRARAFGPTFETSSGTPSGHKPYLSIIACRLQGFGDALIQILRPTKPCVYVQQISSINLVTKYHGSIQ